MTTLRQNLPDRPAAVRHGDGTAATVMDRHLRIDPQALVDGRADVAGADGAILDIGGVRIGSAAAASTIAKAIFLMSEPGTESEL